MCRQGIFDSMFDSVVDGVDRGVDGGMPGGVVGVSDGRLTMVATRFLLAVVHASPKDRAPT
jgi:hypothetical protein